MMNRNAKIFLSELIMLFLWLNSIAYAQDSAGVTSKTNYTRLALISGVTAGVFVYGYTVQNNMWWKGEKSKFHFNWDDDWKNSLGADKYGHFFFGYLITSIYEETFAWADLEKNLLWAMIVSFSYQTFTELRDGFSKQYGFSWGDFTANAIGVSIPYLRRQFNWLNYLDFKLSYYPSRRFKEGSNRYIIDDYESTYNWISIDINKMLGVKILPAFMNIALGHGVKNLDISNKRTHEFFLALDWNLINLPGDSNFLLKLKKMLNFYRLPSPAVRIYPDVIWYGIKF